MRYWFNESRNEIFEMEIPPPDAGDCIEVNEDAWNEYMEFVRAAEAEEAAKYKSPASRSIHEAMSDLHGVGAIDDTKMCEFDERCLAPPTQPVPETASVDMEKLARVWRKMQDVRDKLSHDFKLADLAIESQQDQVGAALLAAMNTMKGTKLTTAAGIVEKKTSMKASGKDWGAIQRFIVEHGAWELLHKRLSTKFIEDWSKKHDGELPPGISVYTEFKISVTKPGSKEPPKAEE